MQWTEQASCRGLNDDTFFPNDNGQGVEYSAVYRTCFDCPVKMQCRIAGISERDGIWGGSSMTERVLYRRLITPSVSGIGGREWDGPMREWSELVLDRVDRGMDLTESLLLAGVDRHTIQALYAPTVGDRFAMRAVAKQEEATTMGKKR